MAHVSPSFSATLRVALEDKPGSFARLAGAIGEAAGSLGAIDLVRVEGSTKIRDVTVSATGEEHLLLDRGQRVRDVRQGAHGALYIVTDEQNGELWKLAPRR